MPPSTNKLILIAMAALSGLLWGLSQPLVIAPNETPIDPSGYSGLLILIAFVPVLVAIREAGPKLGYWLGWVTCLVAFSIIVYWVTVAMTVFGGVPWAVAIPVLLLLTSALACYVAAAFAVTRFLCRRYGWPQWLVFAGALTTVELLRNYGPVSGFPWGSPGYSVATLPLLLQGASLVGVYGLVFAIGLVNGALAAALIAWRRKEPLPKRALITAVVVVALWCGWGAVRLGEPELPTVKVGLLQGNIDQKIKNDARLNRSTIVDRYHRLQKRAVEAGAEVIVWPEAALPSWVRTGAKDLRETDALKTYDGPLPQSFVVGAVAHERAPKGSGMKRYRYNTALIAAAEDGRVPIEGRFDKSHLVPFGEYVPWPLDDIIRQLVPTGSLQPGGELIARPLKTKAGEISAATTICYEGIFPEISRELTNDGARVMFNVTNDAWYGVSSAAIQHLLMYSMRAAETGRAVARAANTGISAWIDTRGRVHDPTKMYVEAVVVADVPLSEETTVYAAIGDVVPLACVAWILGAWIYLLLGPGFWRRQRAWPEWVAGGAGIATFLVLFVTFHVVPGLNRDESWLNRVAVGGTAALLAGVGALSGRPWGRKAQLWIYAVFFVACGAGGIVLGAWVAIVLALACAVLWVVAFRRKSEYTRELDVERDDG